MNKVIVFENVKNDQTSFYQELFEDKEFVYYENSVPISEDPEIVYEDIVINIKIKLFFLYCFIIV